MRTCLLLVGGFGTRISHILGDVPKPLAPVNGAPFLYWLVLLLYENDVRHIVLLSFFHAEQIEKFANDLHLPDLIVEVVVEPSAMGTAGSISYALSQVPDIDDEFFIMNGEKSTNN